MGQTLTRVGFQGRNGFAYHDPEGRSLEEVFLRSRLRFARAAPTSRTGGR